MPLTPDQSYFHMLWLWVLTTYFNDSIFLLRNWGFVVVLILGSIISIKSINKCGRLGHNRDFTYDVCIQFHVRRFSICLAVMPTGHWSPIGHYGWSPGYSCNFDGYPHDDTKFWKFSKIGILSFFGDRYLYQEVIGSEMHYAP